ncbi:hypothetical protein FRB90_012291, partial [Tulasnella sp. 427]
ANFLINDDGRGALCDFGAAHELGDMFQEIVSKSAQRCTVRWTSPERLDTDGPPTTYSDIWSWGWLVWEIMTEKPPFNLVNNMSAVIYHIIMLKLPACDSEARFAELPLLSRLIQSCWGSEPDTRPSIFSCLKELKHILSQFGTHPSFNQREQSAQSTILAKSPGPVLEVNHPDPRAHEKKGSLHDAPPPDVESVDTVTKQQKTDPMNSPSAESLEKSLIQPRYVYDYGHLVTPNVPPASEPSSSPNLPQRNAEIAPKYSFVSRALPRPSTTTRQPKLKRPFTDLSVQPPSLPAVGNEFNLAFLDFEQSGLADGPETSPSAGPSRLAGEGDSEESSEVTTERPIKRRKLQSQAVGFDDVDNELDDAEGQVVDPPELSSPVHYVQANSFQVVYPPRRALAFSGAFELGSSPLVGEEPTTRSDKPVLSLKKRCRRRASPGAVFRRASKSTRSSNGVVRFRETEIEVYHSMPDQGGAATRQAIILETQQLVAVKLLSSLVPPSLGQVSSVKGGFLRWMKKVPKLESPRIAAPMGYVFFKNVPAILSQWNTSGNVTDFLQNNPNIDRQRLLRQVVEGLSYLHELTEPVLHSNIKPSNILIDDAGNAMLGDVGVLAFLEQCSPDHRLQGKAEDTRWTAPEVLEGQARDKSSDVYSLGCVALFILKDKLPYGNQASDIAVVKAIARGVMPFDDSQMSTLHDVWKDCLSRETYLRPGIEDVQRSVGSWPLVFQKVFWTSSAYPRRSSTLSHLVALADIKDSDRLEFWRQRLTVFRIDRSQLSYENDGKVIAAGGFGCVRKAILQRSTCAFQTTGNSSREPEGQVAVKALQTYGDIDIDRLERRFIREAYVWSQLKHDNILEFLGFHFSHSDGVVEALLVCPCFENGQSVTYLKRHRLSTLERLRLLLDAAEGLHYLHSRDPPICHGDIKGANFLINNDGRGALCDFGSAHELDEIFQEIVSKSNQRCTLRSSEAKLEPTYPVSKSTGHPSPLNQMLCHQSRLVDLTMNAGPRSSAATTELEQIYSMGDDTKDWVGLLGDRACFDAESADDTTKPPQRTPASNEPVKQMPIEQTPVDSGASSEAQAPENSETPTMAQNHRKRVRSVSLDPCEWPKAVANQPPHHYDNFEHANRFTETPKESALQVAGEGEESSHESDGRPAKRSKAWPPCPPDGIAADRQLSSHNAARVSATSSLLSKDGEDYYHSENECCNDDLLTTAEMSAVPFLGTDSPSEAGDSRAQAPNYPGGIAPGVSETHDASQVGDRDAEGVGCGPPLPMADIYNELNDGEDHDTDFELFDSAASSGEEGYSLSHAHPAAASQVLISTLKAHDLDSSSLWKSIVLSRSWNASSRGVPMFHETYIQVQNAPSGQQLKVTARQAVILASQQLVAIKSLISLMSPDNPEDILFETFMIVQA